jgi:hypothetical protein
MYPDLLAIVAEAATLTSFIRTVAVAFASTSGLRK